MTGLVIDASAIIELLLDDERSDKLYEFLQERHEEERWVAPEFCLLECTNAIWKCVRKARLTEEESRSVMTSLHNFPLRYVQSEAYLDETLRLALRHKLPACDSCYLALAADFGCLLVSLDRGQLRAAGAEGLSLINLASHPL